MAQVGVTELRRHLAEHLDRVEADRTELVVSRREREDLAIIPLAELECLRETMHLLGTPANAARLREGIEQLDAGKGREHTLIDPWGSSGPTGTGTMTSTGRRPIPARFGA